MSNIIVILPEEIVEELGGGDPDFAAIKWSKVFRACRAAKERNAVSFTGYSGKDEFFGLMSGEKFHMQHEIPDIPIGEVQVFVIKNEE